MSDDVEYRLYRRTAIAELVPWHPGMDMADVLISVVDREAGSPQPGDMIARNPANHDDRWLVAKDYFEAYFAPRPTDPHRPVSLAPGETVVGPEPDGWRYEMPVFNRVTGQQVDTVWMTLRDPPQRGTGRRQAVYHGPIEEADDG